MSDGEGAAEDRGLLREWADGHQRVTHLELFFDLVYVFAITQLSHLLLGRLTWRAGAEMILLLLAVWWAWPPPSPRRSATGASSSPAPSWPSRSGAPGSSWRSPVGTPSSATSSGASSAGSASPGSSGWPVRWWTAAPGGRSGSPPWPSTTRGPSPGSGRPAWAGRPPDDWQIAGDHLVERCQLFVIVALGESILVTGSTFSDLPSAPEHLAGLVVAFAGSVAMWWISFDRTATVSSEVIARSPDPGRLGRSAYTYFHLPIVAGPALLLLGHALFKWAVFQTVTYPRLVGVALLLALVPVGQAVPPLLLASLSAMIVGLVAASDVLLPHPQGDLPDHRGVEELELDER